ncbi:RNA polymerase sigma-70 factor (ECF subfamily) [Frondihabitans sp. PhB188]|uniref:sigma-70 family RNA polymerase sigma factor n=1 Tax=Frondihabitans sp. PhB188 TaxID=2485200 RepID=UPI000F4AC2DA|nr:sigma-70 family RNA polymerase sigma factor [Frondihabitans sp. PhB188]ROQ30252.1 RNA polymerase sigma-70 factor (ECF subfamily) [Frondihabitans sp. PhB188]
MSPTLVTAHHQSLDDPAALLVALAAGDETAFEALYRGWRERFFAAVLRVLRDPAQTEEVVQDIFLELWTHPYRFHPDRGTARGYLYRLARSRAIDRVRASETYRTYTVLAGTHDFHHGTAALGRIHDDWAARHDVRVALTQLTALQREVIELAFFGDLTHTEIAAQLGVPVGTVKSRMTGALTKLRAVAAADGILTHAA